MNISEKIEKFKEVIPYILDMNIRRFVITGIASIPDYFFIISASSTGKYHPEYSLGEGGLLRHTLSSIRIAKELFRVFNFSQEEQDLIIASLVFHDAWKRGQNEEEHTCFDHPLIASNMLLQNKNLEGIITNKQFKCILCNIRSHMGKWSRNSLGDVILPEPKTQMQQFVHLCDYLASRKCLIMDFNVPLST